MRTLEVVSEHSIVPGLLSPGGMVLDVGCRSFTFSRELARRGMNVHALDPDPTITDQHIPNVTYSRFALAAFSGRGNFVMAHDPQARRLDPSGDVEVTMIDIRTFSENHGVGCWDLVKLDCEGSEMAILENWPGKIARQITVEFHEHVAAQSPERYANILSHLGQWYAVVQHEKSKRHCIGTENFWDSLWVLK